MERIFIYEIGGFIAGLTTLFVAIFLGVSIWQYNPKKHLIVGLLVALGVCSVSVYCINNEKKLPKEQITTYVEPYKIGGYIVGSFISNPRKIKSFGFYRYANITFNKDSIEILKIKDSLYCLTKLEEFKKHGINADSIPVNFASFESPNQELIKYYEEKEDNTNLMWIALIPIFSYMFYLAFSRKKD